MSQQMIWVQHPEQAWITAVLEPRTPAEPGSISVRLSHGGGGVTQLPRGDYAGVTQEELDNKCDNLVELERINEGIILHHVKTRYQLRKIYTFVGTILIAVNPYQRLDELYREEMMVKARKKVMQGSDPIPHVYSIAAAALVEMTNLRGDQSVLISGESGSGKTETTKKLLQYLSNSAGKTSTLDVSSAILDSNPVLEAFGNAKTLRNNNSSRFGKYMEVNYRRDGKGGGEIIGCNCISYLLEKSRVVQQTPGERNYHAFYMLLAGADAHTQENLKLQASPNDFRYLNQSQCLEISGRDDKKEFAELLHSFAHVGFSDMQQLQILQVVAGILHLGNVQFEPAHQTAQEKEDDIVKATVTQSSRLSLQVATRLFEMFNCNDANPAAALVTGAVALEKALCVVMIRGATSTAGHVEMMEKPLTVEQAVNNRDALAKAAYDKLFDMIIYQVNKSLYKSRESGWNIGVLDIFGFEVFEVNSFEQLCINYCNEKLQTFFNDVIFDSEIKYYRDEGIDVADISYRDNTACVALIDSKKGGIFAQVADIAVNVQATDEDLCKKLVETFLERKETKSEYFVRSKKRGAFAIKHFAGDVTYTADGFIEKNKDKLPDALTNAFEASTLPVFNDEKVAWNDWFSGPGPRKVYPHPGSALANPGGASGSGSRSNAAAREPLATKFRKDLDSLVVNLKTTTPQFIRCIKPNEQQKPTLLEPVLTLNQLRYSGLFEAIRIRQSGYPLRMTHEQFLSRYKHCVLNVSTKDKNSGPQGYAKALMEQLCLKIKPPFPNVPGEPRNYAIGLHKVFIRKDAMGHALDECREANAGNLVVHIQRVVRGFLGKCRVYHIVGEARLREIAARKNEEKERALMAAADVASVPMNEKRRKKDEKDRIAREQLAEQKRIAAERRLQQETKFAKYSQKLFHMWRDGVKGRRIMAERALEHALEAEDGKCPDCFKVKPCLKHHTRSCNAANMRKYLADALASRSAVMLQDAVRWADDCCCSPSTKCAVLHVKVAPPAAAEDPTVTTTSTTSSASAATTTGSSSSSSGGKGNHHNSLARAFRPVLLPDPAALREEEASANWDPKLSELPPLHVLYADCCRELARYRKEGSISGRGPPPARPSLHCDCRLMLLKRALSRPAASCKVCRAPRVPHGHGHAHGHAHAHAHPPAPAMTITPSVRPHRCIKTRAIAALQLSAKAVILDSLKESYLRQALKDALAVGSDVLLIDAIDKVDACRLGASASLGGIYRQAKEALQEHTKLKATLATLTAALTQASSVPKLLSAVDYIKELVVEARKLGLGEELPVAEAVLRLAKIKGLVGLRNRLRMAIEICSPSLMDRCVCLPLPQPLPCLCLALLFLSILFVFLHSFTLPSLTPPRYHSPTPTPKPPPQRDGGASQAAAALRPRPAVGRGARRGRDETNGELSRADSRHDARGGGQGEGDGAARRGRRRRRDAGAGRGRPHATALRLSGPQ